MVQHEGNTRLGRVALVTGATGFIGKAVVKRLLRDQSDTIWHVLVVMRSKKARKRWSTRRTVSVPVDQRLSDLVRELGFSQDEARRLHCIEASLNGSMDPKGLYESIQKTLEAIQGPGGRLDVVMHLAASLQQDHSLLSPERIERIRERNQSTNVLGLDGFLKVIERFGRPEHVRILRPSIVCGADSRTGIMAFLRQYDRHVLGIRIWTWMRLPVRFLQDVPILGHEKAIIDLIDIKDVVESIMRLLDHDSGPGQTTSSRVGAVYHVSTAYVHGKRPGILKEESVYLKPDQDYNNSYEETKAMAEHVVQDWATKHQGVVEYHHLTHAQAPTLKTLEKIFYDYVGWPQSLSKKCTYYSTREDFEEAMRTMRPRLFSGMYRTYWTRVSCLLPYLLRDPSTRFDCTRTEQLISHPVATSPVSAAYFTSSV